MEQEKLKSIIESILFLSGEPLKISKITNNKKKALLYTGVSALSEPFGAFLAYIFLKNIMNDLILGILFSLIAGIMLQISFCELLPTARRYNNTKYLIIFFLIGVLFMLMKFIL